MVYDPTDPNVGDAQLAKEDWKDTVYGDFHEDILLDAPQGRGFMFNMRAFVDSDHAVDSVTCRSRTGFIIYMNSSPIYWTSNIQTSIETSFFASKFITMIFFANTSVGFDTSSG